VGGRYEVLFLSTIAIFPLGESRPRCSRVSAIFRRAPFTGVAAFRQTQPRPALKVRRLLDTGHFFKITTAVARGRAGLLKQASSIQGALCRGQKEGGRAWSDRRQAAAYATRRGGPEKNFGCGSPRVARPRAIGPGRARESFSGPGAHEAPPASLTARIDRTQMGKARKVLRALQRNCRRWCEGMGGARAQPPQHPTVAGGP